MTGEKLRRIDEEAVMGRLPDAFTVQALCATIRILERDVATLVNVNKALREQIRELGKGTP